MRERPAPFTPASPALPATKAREDHSERDGLDLSLLDLVRLRASQLNGCEYGIQLHSDDARFRGETEERLEHLVAWRSSSLYSDRERAALAWTEALTPVGQRHVLDAVYADVQPHFTRDELVTLTLAIRMINLWNRVAVDFRQAHAKAAPPSRGVTDSRRGTCR